MLGIGGEIFSKKNLQRFFKGFFMFAGGRCCWKLQLTLSDDFSKTMQNAPFKKNSLNQQRRKKVVVAVVVATHSPR